MGLVSLIQEIKNKIAGKKDKKSDSIAPRTSLEYVLIFQQSGLPIYTRCMGQVCKMMAVDETLLSGFLSAISTLPSMFGQDSSERMAIELGKFKLMFHPTKKNNHIICIGIPAEQYNQEAESSIREALSEIERVLEDEFRDEDWNFLSREKISRLEHALAEQVFLKYFEVSETPHEHDEKCPLGPVGIIEPEGRRQNQPIWTRLSNLYKSMKN